MSNESQHTPTPWIVDGDDLTAHIYTGKGRMVNAYHPDNTAFIVRACNSHDALVMVARLVADTYEAEQARGNFPAGQTWGTIDHTTGQAARAALKLAGEG